MYRLMNKDREIARFVKEDDKFEESFRIVETVETSALPIGFVNINAWLRKRQAAKHRAHIRRLMEECGCLQLEGFILVTHATSLNDTFWVKSESEMISWKDVSLYQNEFDEVIARISFEGGGLYGEQFSTTSPEFGTDGAFEKCWRREDDAIYLYKRGSSGARNAGLEPVSEVYASQIAKIICSEGYVDYSLAFLHHKMASKCRLFTSEEIGYTSLTNILSSYADTSEILKFYAGIGSEELFRSMVVLDAIIFNVDRHMGNYGVIYNNDTLSILGMAPVFDFNQSLLPYAEEEDFEHIGEYLLSKGPRIGDDFTHVAKMIITPGIRNELINLHGFHFDYIDDEKFTVDRAKCIEKIVNQQISGILDKGKMYTVDVFPKKFK